MPITQEADADVTRMRRFAEIYREKMEANPFMEILARYDSMTEAGLVVGERELADRYLDMGRLQELLDPRKGPPKTLKAVR